MPRFTNVPPADPNGVGLPIIRTPCARKLSAVITSPDIIGCNTHFWGGRTVPCDPAHCDPCRNGIPYRWHAYCSAFVPQTSLHFLFECTAQAADHLVQYRRAYDTLRGCQFTAYRWQSRPNGRVIIKTEQSAFAQDTLPKAPDLLKVLAVLWQLPPQNLEMDGATEGGKLISPNLHVPGQNDPGKPAA